MRQIKNYIMMIVVAMVLSQGLIAGAKNTRPLVQMAILLDTSGSMNGLIEQAKTRLWKIVNEMAVLEKNGKSPRLEVALYEYGKSSIPASEGYLRMIVPLSVDLDKISEELFKLTTNGGSEYCGRVIQASLYDLKWSQDNRDYKVMFIAGNEPFTQGDVDYKRVCQESNCRGIVVNTIYCGNEKEGIDTMWKDGAERAQGQYLHIDHNQKMTHITAPQDREIIQLGARLNQTYIAYGGKGKKLKKRQNEQDANALAINSGVLTERSITKASQQYKNDGWDLVDAEDEGRVHVGELLDKDLPEEMKKMTLKERQEYVEKMRKERRKIQIRISQLKRARDNYIIEKRKEESQKNTLDEAIISVVKKQAQKKKFHFNQK